MESERQDRNTPTLVRIVSTFFSKLRRLIGNLIKFAQRNQLEELGDQTRRLGSATVESVTFVSGELRAMEERLSRIEEELAALRRLLEERQGDEPEESESRPDRVASGPPTG
jgi:hypothetical protein